MNEKIASQWIGESFYWMLNGFKGDFYTHLDQEYENRNVWTGYLISLLFFAVLVYFII